MILVDWEIDFPEAKGKYQSPIDIITQQALFHEALLENPLVVNYENSCFEDIKNNGHTFIVTGSSASGTGISKGKLTFF